MQLFINSRLVKLIKVNFLVHKKKKKKEKLNFQINLD